jgi:hypothetical protein
VPDFFKISVNQALEAFEPQIKPKAASEADCSKPRIVEGPIRPVSDSGQDISRVDKTA